MVRVEIQYLTAHSDDHGGWSSSRDRVCDVDEAIARSTSGEL